MRYVNLLLLLFLTQCGEHRANRCIAALSDSRGEVRRQASYELVTIGAPAVEPLIAAAAQGTDSLRYISAQILGRIGDRRSVPLLQELAEYPNPFVRREAVLALGKMGNRDLIPFLGRALIGDSAGSVRAAAAQSLANFRDTSAVSLLLPGLADSAVVVRQQAMVSLYRLWTPAAEQGVIKALGDPDETISACVPSSKRAMPHASVTMAGSPSAIASATVRPKGSCVREGRTKASNCS